MSNLGNKKRKRGGAAEAAAVASPPPAQRAAMGPASSGGNAAGNNAEGYSNANVFSQLHAAVNAGDISNTAAAALNASMNGNDSKTDPNLGLLPTGAAGDADRTMGSSYDMNEPAQGAPSPYPLSAFQRGQSGNAAATSGDDEAGAAAGDGGSPGATPAGGQKPHVGTDEWHKIRRDNHKEVERRRRETINEGINEISKIVPGGEKNKGAILQRACQYLLELKQKETEHEEKRNIERVVLEQAVHELEGRNVELRAQLKTMYEQNEALRARLGDASSGPAPELK